MLEIEILFVSLLVVFAQGTNSSSLSKWQLSWIEGGSHAAPKEFPYMVSVRYRKSDIILYCGGSIINSWHVLTAAHCLSGATPSKVKVVVGTNKLYRGGLTVDVTHIVRHHSFDVSKYDNDIALLRLKQPLFYSSTVQPVRLPIQGENTAAGTDCVLTGWGHTSKSSRLLPNLLRKLQLKTISSTDCRNYYAYIDTKICATAVSGMGACAGDSGGPLICNGKQIGVEKGGGYPDTNCTFPLPIEFTYVPIYVDWIRSHAV